MIRLIYPAPEYGEQVMAYKAAFLAAGDSMDGTSGLRDCESFEVWYADWEKKRREETVPAGLVPATTYLAVDETGTLVGMIDIRHRLNDWLQQFGGHIGYSVAPEHRQKGYAKEMLRLALNECRSLGLSKVLVTCNDDNIASAKTIEHNGGVLESKGNDGENVIRRYWINL